MLVKELASKTGISRHTLDNYLNIRKHIPTIDVAVKIAKVLGVTVEYLATGNESPATNVSMNKETITLVQNYNLLNEEDRKIIVEFVQVLLKHRRKKNIFRPAEAEKTATGHTPVSVTGNV